MKRMGSSGKGEPPRLRHGLEFALLTAVSALFKAVPRRLALSLGAALGQVGWWTRLRRRLVLANIEQALPGLSPREHRRLAAAAARNFGRTVAEFLRFAGSDRRRVLQLVEIEGLEVLTEAVEDGRGAVLVTAHLGAWALYVTALGAAGLPVALLVGVQRNPRVDRLILSIPGDAAQFISKGKLAPRQVLTALREGRVIVMVADHYSSDQKVSAPFLGRSAFTLPLPGSLVARHKVPLLGMAGHRLPCGRHRLEVKEIAVTDLADVAAQRQEVAVCCNRFLGDAVLEHPDQYFWYHDRWKRRSRRRGVDTVGDPRAGSAEIDGET